MTSLHDLIPILPLLIVGGSLVLVMLSIAWARVPGRQMLLTVIGLLLALASLPWVWTRLPEMVTPLLTVDRFSVFYTALILFSALVCTILAHLYFRHHDGNRDEVYLLLLLSTLGALVLVSSRHLASFFIGLELLSLPLYGLIGYTFHQRHSLEAALKYLVLSAAASATLLMGMALMYADTGSLAFQGLGGAGVGQITLLSYAGFALFLAAVAFKLSLAPFHLWTPDVYQGAPAPIGAYLATVSKIAVFAALVRFLMEAPGAHAPLWTDWLAVLAFLSIVLGNVMALGQRNLKRLLGYSSIAHFGYLLILLVANSQMGVDGINLYLLTYVITSLGAFGVLSLMSQSAQGQAVEDITHLRGLFWQQPLVAGSLTVMMLSLAGIPLTAGFMGKFFAVTLGVDAQLWWLLGALVAGSAVGLVYYTRVVFVLFAKSTDASTRIHPAAGGVALILMLAALVLLLGVLPQAALSWVNLSSLSLLRPL